MIFSVFFSSQAPSPDVIIAILQLFFFLKQAAPRHHHYYYYLVGCLVWSIQFFHHVCHPHSWSGDGLPSCKQKEKYCKIMGRKICNFHEVVYLFWVVIVSRGRNLILPSKNLKGFSAEIWTDFVQKLFPDSVWKFGPILYENFVRFFTEIFEEKYAELCTYGSEEYAKLERNFGQEFVRKIMQNIYNMYPFFVAYCRIRRSDFYLFLLNKLGAFELLTLWERKQEQGYEESYCLGKNIAFSSLILPGKRLVSHFPCNKKRTSSSFISDHGLK